MIVKMPMNPKKTMILVCTSQEPKQSQEAGCLAKGSEEVLSAFEQQLDQNKPDGKTIEVKGTLCLNNCSRAICVKIFPGGSTYEQIKPEDVTSIWENHIKKNQEVKDLLAPKVNRFFGFLNQLTAISASASSLAASQRSASNAAIQPVPAAVTAWR